MKNTSFSILVIFASLLMLSSCYDPNKGFDDGKIVVGEINKTYQAGDTFRLDLNNDHNDDFIFHLHYNYADEGVVLYDPSEIYVEAFSGNEVLYNYNEDYYLAYVLALNEGEEVNGHFDDYVGKMVFLSQDLPWKNKGIKFMGFTMNIDNKPCYGWLKMAVDTKGEKLTVYNYAFRDDGRQILAGQSYIE